MCKKFCENLYFAKSGMKFPVSFGSTIGDLWEFYGLSVAFLLRINMLLLASHRNLITCSDLEIDSKDN